MHTIQKKVTVAILAQAVNTQAVKIPIIAHAMADWERDVPDWDRDDDGAGEQPLDPHDYDSLSAEECGNELMEYLVELKRTRAPVTARVACVLAFWASRAGAVGPVAQLGLKPNQQSGKFSVHFDKVTGVNVRDDKLYHMDVPGYKRCSSLRTTMDLVSYLPHEVLAEEVLARSDTSRLFASMQHPPAYYEHPVVKRAVGEITYPVALYIDGVEHSTRGSLIGFSVHSVVTGLRHLCCAIQKRELCACGCRGWCTIFCIFKMLRWSFEACADATYPSTRADGSPHKTDDALRFIAAGAAMPVRFALLYLMGDMSEFVHTYGLPSWMSLLSPCYCCHAPRVGIANCDVIGPGSLAYADKDHDDYNFACEACEIAVDVTDVSVLRRIRGSLHYDKRPPGNKKSACGRGLRCDLPELGLKENDRLEPSCDMCDVSLFESRDAFPFRILFWRRSQDTIAVHRNPLFCDELGVTIQSIMLDEHHVLALGVYQFFIATLVRIMIDQDAFNVGCRSLPMRSALSVARLKDDLFSWYGEQRRAGIKLTEVEDLMPSMFGTSKGPLCRLKGGDTLGVVRCLPALLAKYGDRLRGNRDYCVRGNNSMVKINGLMRRNDHVFPAADEQDRAWD